MKKIIGLIFLSILSTASFAKTCVVATSTDDNPNDYNHTIATYSDVEMKDGMIMTVITKDGDVLRNLNLETYYDGVTSQEEIDARSARLIGSQMAIISVDKKEGQLSLAIGDGTVPDPKRDDNLIDSSAMSLSDLSSSKAALFDVKGNLAIYCVGQ